MRFLFLILVPFLFFSCKKIKVYDAAKIQIAGSINNFDKLKEKSPIDLIKLPNLSWGEFHVKQGKKSNFRNYLLVGEKLKSTRPEINKITDLVFSLDSYKFFLEVACEPRYGFMIEYDDHKIIFCFSCNVVAIFNRKNCVGGGLLTEEANKELLKNFVGLKVE